MAEEKVTTMVLNVDLQCSKCYKRVKKLLCKFPEIRDQTYDEKANKVTIKVVSSSPENIRDKLCRKGGGCIKSIEIVKPPPPKPPAPAPPKPPPPAPPRPEPEPKPKPVKVSVDVQVQGGRPWGPCSCGGPVQVVCDSWCGHGSRCGETQQDCSIM
ncbi:hypothetical protein SLE2022_323020 [Rubroshorea leprosula]